jgi:hypothetical protein
MKFFNIERIKQAITHLEQFPSDWLIPTLVFACNGVNTTELQDLHAKNGTDKFLDRYFSGSLIGLPAFPNNANTLRPRFSDLMSTLVSQGKGDDYVLHQGTKLWANAYSSRGYREMETRGELIKDRSKFKFAASFKSAFEAAIPASFRFEELLVWLYAFRGVPDDVGSWTALAGDFLLQCLGPDGAFDQTVAGRFTIGTSDPIEWPTFVGVRPKDEDFQSALLPSSFTPLVTEADLDHLREALKTTICEEFQGMEDHVESLATDVVAAFVSTKRLFILGDPGVGKSEFAKIISRCFSDVFGASRTFLLHEPITDRTTPESLIGYVSIGGDWISGTLSAKRLDGRQLLYTNEELTFPGNRSQINIVILDEANRRDIEALLARLQSSIDSASLEARDQSHAIQLGSDRPSFLSPFTFWVLTGNSPRDDEGRLIQSRPFRRRPNLLLMPNVFEADLKKTPDEFHKLVIAFWNNHSRVGLLIEDNLAEEISAGLTQDTELAMDIRALLTTLAQFKIGISYGVLKKLFRTAAIHYRFTHDLRQSIDNALATALSPLLSTERRVGDKNIKGAILQQHADMVVKYPRFFALVTNALEEDPEFHITEPFF